MAGASDEHVCPKTGLKLLPSASRMGWRVARTSYGALNPQLRDAADPSRQVWGRWDVPGVKTIYASECPIGSYMETLAWSRPTKDESASKYFSDAKPGETIHAAIAAEWVVEGTMCLWSVPASWRDDRNLYQLELPSAGWLIDVNDSESLSSLTAVLDCSAQLTLSDLSGDNRVLTTRIAEWVRAQRLFDQSTPIGIAYRSRFGTNHLCFALWLSGEGAAEPTKVMSDAPIKPNDSTYQNAARQLRITAH